MVLLVAVSQTVISPMRIEIALSETARVPSGLKATPETQSVCPRNATGFR